MSSGHRIGFVASRLAGTDGVSLEVAKWAAVLERMGHHCFYFAGASDRPAEASLVVPEAFFRHAEIVTINQAVFSGNWGEYHKQPGADPQLQALHRDLFSIYVRPPGIGTRVQELKEHLKGRLYEFVRQFAPEVLIVENALSMPNNLPLGLAITEFIAETGYPVIAHHHDFSWERPRFLHNSVRDYLAAAFPPDLPSIRHVVLNSVQARQLALRIGAAAMVVPNVMDFEQPPAAPDAYAASARKDLGLLPGEHFILQPTRIVQRKGIEHAIELTRRLGLPARLVISHAGGDERTHYELRVREFAALLDVAVNFEADIVGVQRGQTADGRKIYTLGDVYPQAELVTYPSTIEGFGNAFLEAIYYRRPIVVNNYSIYKADLKPKGFRVIEFDGFITDDTLKQARHVLLHPDESAEQAERNYSVARRYYSYSVLERRLALLLSDCFGESA